MVSLSPDPLPLTPLPGTLLLPLGLILTLDDCHLIKVVNYILSMLVPVRLLIVYVDALVLE